jgi:hypothetical protein
MTTLDVLKAARALISDPARWTQNVMARDADGGQYTFGCAPQTVSWCALGALQHITGKASTNGALDALDTQLPIYITIDYFNDTHTHAEVLALFDAAIARLEREAPHE